MTRSCWATTLANVVAPLRPVPWCTATRSERREPRRLGLPVAHDRQRADHQVRARAAPARWASVVGVLPEPHVVGQAAAEAELVEELQPAEAAALVRTQRGHEAGRLDTFGERGVGQTLQQIAEPARGGDRRRRRRSASRCLASSVAAELGGQPQQLERRQLAVLSRCSARLASARRASVRSSRTHRPLTLIRPAPDAAARSSSASSTGVSSTTTVQSMIAAAPNRLLPDCVLRLGDALGGRRATRQAFGCEQLDVDRGQRVDRFERGRGRVEVDAVPAGLRASRRATGRASRCRRARWRCIRRASAGTVARRRGRPRPAGRRQRRPPCTTDRDRRGRRVRATSGQSPCGSSGKCEPQPGPHDRLALGAANGLIEDRRQIVERLDRARGRRETRRPAR